MQRCPQKVINTLLGTTKNATTCLIGSQCSTLSATEALSSVVAPKSAVGPSDSGHSSSAKLLAGSAAAPALPYSGLPGHRSQRYKHVPTWAKLTRLAGGSVLHVAAACGNSTLVNQLLKSWQRELLEKSTCLGYTPLTVAAACGQATAVKALLAAKAETAALTSKGETLLHIAMQSRSNDVLNLLVTKGLCKTLQLVRLPALIAQKICLGQFESSAVCFTPRA